MLTIYPIPSFMDNYIWLLHNEQEAIAVDPGSDTHLLPYLESHQLTLTDILITHHHFDHIGCAQSLADRTGAKIHGPVDERIPTHHTWKNQEKFSLCQGSISLEVLSTPGHTKTHICYLLNQTRLFCGDVLFSAGCGGNFEGRPEDMFHSLMRISALEDTVALYPAHEYTLYNLYFALHVEPTNQDVRTYIEFLESQKKPYCSLPTNVGQEKKINPFLRFKYSDCIIKNLEDHFNIQRNDFSYEELFMLLRQWKSEFYSKS